MLKRELFVEWFELYNSLRNEYKIAPQDIYNMDEKGFTMRAIQKSHVIVPTYKKDALIRQDGNFRMCSITPP
jgi:hypothetical protein